MMLRKTEAIECDNGDDLGDAVNYANNRSDRGRTIIKLSKGNIYIFDKPLKFSNNSRITIDIDGMDISIDENGNGVIR